ncbi:protein of unknown function [Candidatus Nitrospira inopinata]|uniref:Uncharacterized protein n=1 Tax=Candidatus Nitrospira inopinata TaxID=1715989 RepID=A0A0S4KP80_9BACT|nr:protein of unknown function [Candidatus Nitrospira inopinata]
MQAGRQSDVAQGETEVVMTDHGDMRVFNADGFDVDRQGERRKDDRLVAARGWFRLGWGGEKSEINKDVSLDQRQLVDGHCSMKKGEESVAQRQAIKPSEGYAVSFYFDVTEADAMQQLPFQSGDAHGSLKVLRQGALQLLADLVGRKEEANRGYGACQYDQERDAGDGENFERFHCR